MLSDEDYNPNHDADTISFRATCAHCRFLKEEVEEHMASLFFPTETQGKMQQILKRAIIYLNNSILQVGSNTSDTSVKFSVIAPHSSCAFVHLTRYGFISCKSGECKAKSGITKGVKTMESLFRAKNLCAHLSAMAAADRGQIMQFGIERQPSVEDNIDDVDIVEDMVCCFWLSIFQVKFSFTLPINHFAY